eukprot:295030-Chlamydomonas_euryale.AAC.10
MGTAMLDPCTPCIPAECGPGTLFAWAMMMWVRQRQQPERVWQSPQQQQILDALPWIQPYGCRADWGRSPATWPQAKKAEDANVQAAAKVRHGVAWP